ncbi:DUF413 domain-containing protein [Catenovulum sediminis]|uniref:Macrodomain Ori protein n=1 Tax=Catenovulum sediminis TaxID=1740262 RepID=A0ABV1RLN0_9ALTE|nr:DUF413 domain-containing protein [Catenovulum sediminis]
MAKTKQQLLSRIYDDPKNYPYGFRRSGDFSISEADALATYGHLFNALYKGEIQPSDDEDERILAIMRGDAKPENATERAWLKYQSRLNRPKLGSLYGNKKQAVTDVDDDDDMGLNDDLGDSIDPDDD